MSLQIWLPLTKDLRQQGLSNTAITNSGATYSATGGKLGGCYIFDGSDDSIGIGDLSTLVNTDFTFACWFYHDDTWSSKGYETLLGGPSGFELESKVSTTNSPVLKLYNWGGGSCVYELNKWNHVVFTRNTTETKLYLNGELQVTGTAGTIPSGNYFIGAWKTSAQQNFKGNMNDVRIYDHCLSPMEVKQLSQGLILHYPLNRNNWGQENLAKNTNGVIIDGLGSTPGSRNEYYAFNCGTPFLVNAGDTVTVSFDLYETVNTTGSGYLYVYNTNNKGPHQIAGVNVLAGRTIAVGDIIDERISFTTTVSNRSDATQTNDFIEFYSDYGTSNWFKISNLKVEKGSIPTPWCPNSADALATTMGLNSTTEYDCSGFCNNGTRTGTFSWTSDTPKYSVSTKFSGSNYILTDGGTFSWFDFNQLTLAGWMKSTNSPSSYSGSFGIAHNSIDGYYSKCFSISNSSSKFTINAAKGSTWVWITAPYTVPANEWHHYVATLNGTEVKMYVDGELVHSTTIDWGTGTIASDTRFQVGVDLPGSDETYQGYYSDVRAYATALSPSDVKSLYQNCATIDPDGTIRGQIRS